MKKTNATTKTAAKKSVTTKAKAAATTKATATKPTKAEVKKEAKPKVAAESKTKLSAIDAAAKVLATSSEPLNCKDLIAAMATKNLWKSPGGKTPHATLYSAILREITTKGSDSRFVKTERGKFAAA